jgi:hypothetical protein
LPGLDFARVQLPVDADLNENFLRGLRHKCG